MQSNSINWLIDCKKAQTSRLPQSCTRQPSWLMGLCRCMCLSNSGGGSQRRRRWRWRENGGWMSVTQPTSHVWLSSLIKRLQSRTQTFKCEGGVGGNTVIFMCVDLLQPAPTHPFLCLYPRCLRWQTWRDTPFTIFHHRAGHHSNCCFSWLLRLMLRYGGGGTEGVCLGGNTDERGMSEKMASFFSPHHLRLVYQRWLWLTAQTLILAVTTGRRSVLSS